LVRLLTSGGGAREITSLTITKGRVQLAARKPIVFYVVSVWIQSVLSWDIALREIKPRANATVKIPSEYRFRLLN